MLLDALTASELRRQIHYAPQTGRITWRVSRRGVKAGSVAGSKTSHGYLVVTIGRKKFYAHRLAYLYMTGSWPEVEVDHRDGNRANNRWRNLRKATIRQNQHNRRANNSSAAGVKGVVVDRRPLKKPYHARIFVNGRRVFLGSFKTAAQAASAYARAAKSAFGQFARLS